jgi:ABC-type phosphate transport system substrate-binding protein
MRQMRLPLTVPAAIFLVAAVLPLPAGVGAAAKTPGPTAVPRAAMPRTPLAVIVNRSNPTETLGRRELRALFLGEKTAWPHGRRVTLVLREPGQAERAAVLRLIYAMSEDDLSRHFMHQAFTGGSASGPRALATADGVKRFVFNVPGAIGVVRLADVDATVKAIKIDGASPSDPGYGLVMGEA